MRKTYPFLLFVLATLAIACGGGGGGGGGGTSATTGTNGGTTFVMTRIEAVLQGQPNQPIDPTNIQVGETVQFQVVGYTAAGARTVLGSTAWTTTDTQGQAGDLSLTGVFVADTPSATAYTISARAGGKNFTATYRVRPVQSLITGRVNDSNGRVASGVAVRFFTAAGVEVGRATTAFNGYFRASVPTTARELNLDPATLPTTRYTRSFLVGTSRYTALEPTCGAPLPTLTVGATHDVGTVIVDAARDVNGNPLPPPPPPDGCFG